MSVLAKILAVLISLEGVLALFFPSTAKAATVEFDGGGNKGKRLFGAFFLAAGLFLILLTEMTITDLLVHWFIAVYGVFTGLYGLLLIILPKTASSFLAWIYAERGPSSLIGGLLLGAGVTFFILL